MIVLEYKGKKPYRDRTALRFEWQPGDVKRIPKSMGKALLKFAEFSVSEKASDAQADDVAVAILAHEQHKTDEHNEVESMLMLVDSMDKDALEAYAERYEVKLDKRRNVESLRADVASLIEQFGAR